jgi:putative transposase
MARMPRVQYSGAIHHVTARGASRATIFRNDRDYSAFLATLAGAIGSTGWECLAYCLMPNHYHLLLETPEANLSEGMYQLNSTYARRFNWEHDHTGHVFQSRFHATLVTGEAHLFEALRYVVLNPVRGAVADSPADWRWSSYRATVGMSRPPRWFQAARVLALFAVDAESAQREYGAFVHEGIGVPRSGAPPLDELITPVSPAQIAAAGRDHGYTQATIARHLGVSQATISRILRAATRE